MLSIPAFGQVGDTPGSERLLRVEIDITEPARQLSLLRSLDFDIPGYHRKSGTASLIVDEAGLAELERLGFSARILEDLTPSKESTEALNDYHDEAESDAAVTRIADANPSIAHRFEYAYSTAEGRVVAGLLISDNVDVDEAEPRILFVSQHHAREVMTPEALIDMADYLVDNYGVDPEVTDWVNNFQIYIIPCHNPDGTHHVFNVNTNWRKNRRDNGDGSFGVDPNRNYPYAWGPDGCNGSSGTPSSDTYRGPSAASEPETQGIVDLARQANASITLTYHTYSELVLHPMGCSPSLPDDPDLRAHRELGSALAASIENDAGTGWYEMGTPYELLYDVDGGSDDWLHAATGSIAFTIEMNSASQGFQPDYDTWRDDTILRNREGWKYLIRRMSGSSVQGRIYDACSGAGLEAEIGVAEQVFTKDQEPRMSMPGHGFFHRILEPGEYTWYAEAPSYQRQEWPVSVAFEPVSQDIWLVPEGSFGLELRRFVVDDAAFDNDGQLDPGEEVELWINVLASGGSVDGVTATLSSDDPYLQILESQATIPDLAAGAEDQATSAFRVKVLEDAPDGHLATVSVSFAANESLCRSGSDSPLRITRGIPANPFLSESLDEDPAWAVSGPSGGWEFGVPQGSGGTSGPSEAHTGNNVYATNLSGNYGSSQGEFVLTAGPFDLQGLRNAELRFWRWLNDEPAYDPGRVEVSIDGENWTEIWRGFGRDTRWEEYRLDLPEFVDDEAQVQLRFILLQDGGTSRSGFYIDDISFVGESVLTAGGKLKYEAHTIVEDDLNYGNADGALDVGETAGMIVTLRSTRNAPSYGISALLTTSAPGVVIHNDVAFFPDLLAGATAESLAPHFSFTTGPECAASIPFTLDVRDASGSSSLSHFTVRVGSLGPGTLLIDDMESDQGWIVDDTQQAGAWERTEPHPSYYQDETTNPDADHTPDPGVIAWNTQSVQPPVIAPPYDAEVDSVTSLETPALSAASFERLELSYWRWFYTGGGPGPDSYRVEVSQESGGFRTVEEVTTKANHWVEVRKELTEFVTPFDGMVLRFVVSDGGGESIVEAGLDDFELSGDEWLCDEFSAPLLDPPNPVGNSLLVTRLGFDLRLEWTEPAEDSGHGPATFYEVTRSEQADTGFSGVGEPTAPLHVDMGAAGPSQPAAFFYLVSSRNSGS